MRRGLTALVNALVAAGLAGLAPAVHAAPVDYDFDPTHSFVTFEIVHFDASTIRGRIGPIEGSARLDRESRRGRIQAIVPTASVSTGVAPLDARLRGDGLFATATFPQAFFVAEAIELDTQGAPTTLRGEFTLRGQSQGLTLTAQRFRCYFQPLLRREVCGGDFSAEFDRSAFGMTDSLPFVADRVRLLIQIEAIRREPD